MEPQLINNFATAAFCALKQRFWHQFGGRLQYRAHQNWASFQHWQLGTLLTRQHCDSLVQQVTDSGSKGYWCLAGNWVYPCRRGHPRLLVFSFLVVMNHGVWTNRQLYCLHPHKGFPGWEGRKRLTRPSQAWDDDRKHGRDRSATERRPKPACLIGMLVTSFLLQKTHCIFFPCWFLWLCPTPPVPLFTWSMEHFAVGIWVWGLRGSFSIWKMLDVLY